MRDLVEDEKFFEVVSVWLHVDELARRGGKRVFFHVRTVHLMCASTQRPARLSGHGYVYMLLTVTSANLRWRKFVLTPDNTPKWSGCVTVYIHESGKARSHQSVFMLRHAAIEIDDVFKCSLALVFPRFFTKR